MYIMLNYVLQKCKRCEISDVRYQVFLFSRLYALMYRRSEDDMSNPIVVARRFWHRIQS